MLSLKQKFGKRVKELRKSKGITQEQIAELINIEPLIDCGTEDFFYQVNCNLHNKLMEAGIPHDFYVRPGVHNWDYWRNSIKYQMLFFSDYFTKAAQSAK